MVVMNGLAITAGSKPIFFASIGRVQPINFDTIIVSASVIPTTTATITETLSISKSLTKLAAASVIPQSIETRNSFHIIWQSGLQIQKRRVLMNAEESWKISFRSENCIEMRCETKNV